VRDSQDLYAIIDLTEHDEKGESPEEVSTRFGEVTRPAARYFLDPSDRQVELGHECLRRLGISGVVPLSCSAGLRIASG